MKYYKENEANFMEKKQYKASHILIKTEANATSEVKSKAKEKAEKLFAEITGGAKFAKLALENSDDPGSKVNGGDLGYFSLGTMVKEFESTMVKLNEGQVSKPILTQFGFHIIRLDAIKEEHLKPFSKVEDIARKMASGDAQKEQAKKKAQEFIATAKTGDFEKQAKNFGLAFDTTGFFTRGQSIPGSIGYSKEVSSSAFSLDMNQVSEPVETPKGIYVLKLVAKKAVDMEAFKKDQSTLKTTVLEEKRYKILADFYEKLKNKAKVEILVELEDKSKKV